MKRLILILLLFVGFAAHSQHHMMYSSSINLRNGLVGVWELDETSGTTVYDSYSTNNGINTGTATVAQTGKINYAYDFDGTNDYVDFNTRLISGFPFSISIWVKFDVLALNLFASNREITNYSGVLIVPSSGNITVYFGNNTGTGATNRKSFQYNTTLSINTWYNIVVTANSLSSSDIKVYVNGSSIAYFSQAGSAATAVFNVGESHLGQSWTSTTAGRTNGLIDQTIIWNRILNISEVKALYNNGSGLPYPL